MSEPRSHVCGHVDSNTLAEPYRAYPALALILSKPVVSTVTVKPLCRTIRDILFPYRDGLFIGTLTDRKVLYEPIVTAFDDAIASLASGQVDSA